MTGIPQEIKDIILSHDLRNQSVREMLGGFLTAGILAETGIRVPRDTMMSLLGSYVTGIDTLIDETFDEYQRRTGR